MANRIYSTVMSTELGDTSAPIEPYLSPAYWSERFINDGTAKAWPELGEAGPKDWMLGVMALSLFAKQGARRLASSRLHPGDAFDASSHEPGTILVTLAEKLWRVPGAEGVVSMDEFQGVPVPDRLPGIVDGEQTFDGHGYRYEAQPLLNLIVGRQARRVLVIPDAVVGEHPDFDDKDYTSNVITNMSRGFTEFTVGEVYNFGSNDDPNGQTLARVTEAIVCMGGARGRKVPSLRSLLAARLGGSALPATNPATN